MKTTIKGRLSGIRIGVTGTEKLTDKLSGQLREHGAYVENLSFLQVREYEDNTELKNAITNLKDYTWIVFTSTNGVEIFFKKLKENNIDYRNLSGFSFAVVGKGTKDALIQHGFIADYMPEIYTTTALANGLATLLNKEDHVLIPRALKGSKDLTDILSKNFIPFEDLKIYSIEIDEEKYSRVTTELADFDYITFASASGVDGFFENSEEDLRQTLNRSKIVSIGDITAKRLEGYGVTNYIIAKEYSVPGLVESILKDADGEV